MIVYGILDEDRAVIARLQENYDFQSERRGMIALVAELPDVAHVLKLIGRLSITRYSSSPRIRTA